MSALVYVAGAVRIMPAVGHGVPGTSTGVIETDSAFTQHSVRQSQVTCVDWSWLNVSHSTQSENSVARTGILNHYCDIS